MGLLAAAIAGSAIAGAAISAGTAVHNANLASKQLEVTENIENKYYELANKDYHKFSQIGLTPAEGALLTAQSPYTKPQSTYRVFNGTSYSKEIPIGVQYDAMSGMIANLYNSRVKKRPTVPTRSQGVQATASTTTHAVQATTTTKPTGTQITPKHRSVAIQQSPTSNMIHWQYGGIEGGSKFRM